MVASPGGVGLGFGDVNFAGTLGVLRGWFSWQAVLGGALCAFVISAPWAIGLLITKRTNRHTQFAFGPFMIAATVLVLLAS